MNERPNVSHASKPRHITVRDHLRPSASTMPRPIAPYSLAPRVYPFTCPTAQDIEVFTRVCVWPLAMTSTSNYQYEITSYEQAPAAYEQWVSGAPRWSATLERAALLAMVGQDLASGPLPSPSQGK
jgi:hypothetical protein